MLPHLRDLTALRREGDLLDLLCGFDQRRAELGWPVRDLVSELYRLTAALLQPAAGRRRPRSQARSRVAEHRMTEGAVLWAALVLAAEDALIHSVREDQAGYRRGPDLTVPALAAVGRAFLERHERAETGDPVDGRWADLVRTLRRCGTEVGDDPGHVIAPARGGLVRALAARLACVDGGPPWFQVLAGEAHDACARLAKSEGWDNLEDVDEGTTAAEDELHRDQVQRPPAAQLPRTFAAVVGREHAVAGLRRHARDRTNGVDVLLHGPAGAGKLTLARIYARMLLCKAPLPDGEACGTCRPCSDKGNGGVIELDGADPRIDDLSRQLSKKVGTVERISAGHFLQTQLVFIVNNAECLPPEAFDRLLQPMEHSAHAGFVLLAQDRCRVRVAGQSRCFDYRVRPLVRTEARDFLLDIGRAHGDQAAEAALDLLIDVGEGLPGRLLEACERVSAVAPSDLAAMRAALGLDWGEALVGAWPALVAGAPAALAALNELVAGSGVGRVEWVRRIRAVLHGLRHERVGGGAESGTRTAVDSALRHVSDPVWGAFAAALDRRAAQSGTTAEAVWAHLVVSWMADRAPYG